MPKPKRVGVAEYLVAEKADLDKFAAWYEEQRKLDPEHFDEKLDLGQWWEQYVAWGESIRQ